LSCLQSPGTAEVGAICEHPSLTPQSPMPQEENNKGQVWENRGGWENFCKEHCTCIKTYGNDNFYSS
jgi:hypothetical protein